MKPFAYSTILASFYCLFIHILVANSTSIITVRTPDEIVIGADSNLGDEAGHQIGTICKIRQAGDAFFAIAGVPLVRGEGIDFDIDKITSDIFSRKMPIEERLATYDAIVKWNLIQIVDRVRHNKTLFDLVYHHEDNVALSLTVAMIEKDFPVAYHIEYIIMNSAKEPARIKSVTKKFTDSLISEIDIIYSAQDQRICNPIIGTSNIKNLDKTISKCIELIAKERPTVKLPIDILRITKDRAEWVQHKPECPEIDQKFFKHPN